MLLGVQGGDVRIWLNRLRDMRFIRYFLASVGALAIDFGSFVALMGAGMNAMAASALGYTLGIIAHWLLSSRKVFHETVAHETMARTRQKALFVISALVGLGLTTVIVGIGSGSGIDPRLAKLVAIAVSFVVTYVLRSKVVFRSGTE
ncbi:GtrA family protein [Erythrobacteraceae bacterium E2-1 Yellow Sea]|nr:GtrA family protein [Erythrobacteraceae bacterium E2-1 Yellow Sea]